MTHFDPYSDFPEASPAAPAHVALTLIVTDPEVVAELERHSEGGDRARYALTALRIGTLCLRQASGELDGDAVKRAGDELLAELREVLTTRTSELTSFLVEQLTRYFDPESGSVHERLRSLIARDGELERVLQAHIGSDQSVLARTLAEHLGEQSPLFRLLDPEQADGVRAQVASTIEEMVGAHRAHILRQFSLDDEESALSRLVRQLEKHQAEVGGDVKEQIDLVVKEFSLDHPDSALSRMAEMLKKAQARIDEHLTLDEEDSALARLRRELVEGLETLSKRNADFHTEVREAIAALQARKKEAARGTRHGDEFEDQAGAEIARLAARQGDIYEHTGPTTGAIKNCKVGDHVVELGPESRAPGARLVWESKEQEGYKLPDALAEIDKARKNRRAQIGIFVYSARTAPPEVEPFARFGDAIVVRWDPEDPMSDVLLLAAYSVARGLAVGAHDSDEETAASLQEIERAARAIEKQIGYLDHIQTWVGTIQNNSSKVLDRVAKMQANLTKEIERVDEHVRALSTGGAGGEE